jgi:hypothetical protein
MSDHHKILGGPRETVAGLAIIIASVGFMPTPAEAGTIEARFPEDEPMAGFSCGRLPGRL